MSKTQQAIIEGPDFFTLTDGTVVNLKFCENDVTADNCHGRYEVRYYTKTDNETSVATRHQYFRLAREKNKPPVDYNDFVVRGDLQSQHHVPGPTRIIGLQLRSRSGVFREINYLAAKSN